MQHYLAITLIPNTLKLTQGRETTTRKISGAYNIYIYIYLHGKNNKI